MTCERFPDTCPNLRALRPDPPHHDGGIRCGCADPGPGVRIALDEMTSDQLDALYERVDIYRAAWHSARGRAAHLGCINADLRTELRAAAERAEQAEAAVERDGAYRERAHLVALLAAMASGAVIAPAPDVDEPGWQIVYLTIGGRQASWHIAPQDAELFAAIERVPPTDPRAQWDGHTSEQKYAAIRVHTAALADRSGGPVATQATNPEQEKAMPKTKCNATISGIAVPDDETVTCTVEDIDQHPANHVGPRRPYGQVLWTDRHAGATPHQPQA